MTGRPVTRCEREAWLAFGLWTVLIFVSIPIARALRDLINSLLGNASLGYATLIAIAAAGLSTSWFLLRKTRSLPWRAVAWITAVALVLGFWALRLWAQPEEAVHLVEYGVLSLLAANALRHRCSDRSLFLQAALLAASIGVADEIIQWLNPSRYFGFRDIGVNAGAAALAQLALAKGILRGSRTSIAPTSVVRTCILGIIFLVLLSITLALTPARIEALGDRFPFIPALHDVQDVMGEYGYLHKFDGLGQFKSRFQASELAHIDHDHGAEAAHVMNPRTITYQTFLSSTSRVSEAFAREARIHLSSRNRRRKMAREASDPVQRAQDAAVALGEDRILERFWNNTITHAHVRLAPDVRARLEAWADPNYAFTSKVDRHLITWINEKQALGLVSAGIVLLLIIAFLASRRAHRVRTGSTGEAETN